MTIYVQTSDFGEKDFEADDWDVRETGDLWVGTDEVGVAEFAKGAWLFVYEVVDAAPKEPAQIIGLSEEHRDRKWVDRYGWEFSYVGGAEWVASKGLNRHCYTEPFGQSWGPMTEVLDA